jgi:hypothetical protein
MKAAVYSRARKTHGPKRPPSRKDNLAKTAYHEAGHAVLQLALGIGCEGITIVPNHAEGAAGAATHGGEWGKPAQGPDDQDDDVSNLRTFAEEAFLLRHAIANYAGAEAVRRWKPRRKTWRNGATDDYRRAVDRINQITSDTASIDLLFKYAQRRCRILVAHYWPEISAVASLALKRKSITGEQAREAWSKSLAARRGGLMSW